MDTYPDPEKEIEVDPDPGKEIEVDPDPRRGLKWIRIRPNAVDPELQVVLSMTELIVRYWFVCDVDCLVNTKQIFALMRNFAPTANRKTIPTWSI